MKYTIVYILTVYMLLGCNIKPQNNEPLFLSNLADSILNLVHNPSNTSFEF